MDEMFSKPPTTFEEQLSILVRRNLIVEDEEFALSVLRRLNYYRFTGYLLPFRIVDNKYADGTTFGRVYNIYEFDRRLRGLLIGMLEGIEVRLRTQLSYHLAHTYGGLGHLDSHNFRDPTKHARFIESLQSSLRDAHKNKELFAIHHFDKYKGQFPIWVAVEVMSFGVLSKLFMNLHGRDRSRIAKQAYGVPHEHLGSWLECLVYVRNMCAHYTRLYDKELKIKPKLFSRPAIENDRLFAAVYVSKRLFDPRKDWNNDFIAGLQSLVDQYKDDIDLGRIGFPQDWLKVLRD